MWAKHGLLDRYNSHCRSKESPSSSWSPFLFSLLFLRHRVPLCSPALLETHYVDQNFLEFRDPTASSSQVLRSEMFITMLFLIYLFVYYLLFFLIWDKIAYCEGWPLRKWRYPWASDPLTSVSSWVLTLQKSTATPDLGPHKQVTHTPKMLEFILGHWIGPLLQLLRNLGATILRCWALLITCSIWHVQALDWE